MLIPKIQGITCNPHCGCVRFMANLIKIKEFKDDLSSIENENKLLDKVERDLDLLKDEGTKTLYGSNRPPETSSMSISENEKVYYVTTKANSKTYRSYFDVAGDYMICLLGWKKDQQTVPRNIKQKILNRLKKVKRQLKDT